MSRADFSNKETEEPRQGVLSRSIRTAGGLALAGLAFWFMTPRSRPSRQSSAMKNNGSADSNRQEPHAAQSKEQDSQAEQSDPEDPRQDFLSYCIGAGLAVLFTGLAFWFVAWNVLGPTDSFIAIIGLAVVQIVAHFRFFLHIDLKKSHRDDLQLILFTCVILFLIVGGSIWILWNLHFRML